MTIKKLGFGCMRLPVLDGAFDRPDKATFSKMIDRFVEKGFSYFDTGWFYHEGKSEAALKECLVDRYPRDSFVLADKMPIALVQEAADLDRFFSTQLGRCGVDHFDYYLLHDLSRDRMECVDRTDAFGFVRQRKAEGAIGRIGLSFHDTAEALDDILAKHPEVEFVQLQLNYLDWDSPGVQSRMCCEVAQRHGVPVIAMEPVKGGTLADIPEEAIKVLNEVHPEWTPAEWALRFAASHESVLMVLSGMSELPQLEENMTAFGNIEALSSDELETVFKAAEIINANTAIPCTGCSYCVSACSSGVDIPRCFALYNEDARERQGKPWTAQQLLYGHLAQQGKGANQCIGCASCEPMCPQHLPIRQLLHDTAQRFRGI